MKNRRNQSYQLKKADPVLKNQELLLLVYSINQICLLMLKVPVASNQQHLKTANLCHLPILVLAHKSPREHLKRV
jgi:hypothetical protein